MALKYRPKYWHYDDKSYNEPKWDNWNEVLNWNGVENANRLRSRLRRLREEHKDSYHANARDAFNLCNELLSLLNYKDPEGKKMASKITLSPKLKKLIKRYDLSSEEFFEVEDEIAMEQDCIHCDDEEPFLDENYTEKILNNWKGTCDEGKMHKAKYNPRLSDKELQDIIRKTFKQKIEMSDDPITGARDRRKQKNE